MLKTNFLTSFSIILCTLTSTSFARNCVDYLQATNQCRLYCDKRYPATSSNRLACENGCLTFGASCTVGFNCDHMASTKKK